MLLEHRVLMLVVMAATIALTVDLYIKTPKGYFPQDDTGLIFTSTRAAPDISYKAMVDMQLKALDIILADPAVAGVGSSVGGSAWSASVNQGRMFVSLKPLAERDNIPTARVIDRLRPKFARIPGIEVWMFPAQDVRVGGRWGRSQYQFTLWSSDLDELLKWVPRAVERVKTVPGVVDVSTDREQGGFQLNVSIDRQAAARLGVRIQDIDAALANAYAQRQVSTIYTQRNQYRVILEVDPQYQRDPNDLSHIFVSGQRRHADSAVQRGALRARHRAAGDQSPGPVSRRSPSRSACRRAWRSRSRRRTCARRCSTCACRTSSRPSSPATPRLSPSRPARSRCWCSPRWSRSIWCSACCTRASRIRSRSSRRCPRPGSARCSRCKAYGAELTIIAFIGIILLIGIVKKNGIMLVDFALDAERNRGLPPERAIYEACMERFRPILMTTLAALLGAVPLVIASGPGSELRRPLGITIIGGLLVSQILTLYTTPVIYLLLDRLHRKLWGKGAPVPAATPAE